MEKKNLISVIVPVTRKSFLSSCIASLLNNDLSDCEIIFYFNNFKKEKKIINLIKYNLKNKCKRLRVIFNKKFLQIYKSWEKALSYHHGKWVMFLCEDDLLFNNSIDKLKKIILKNRSIKCFFWEAGLHVYNHDNMELKILKKKHNIKTLKKFTSKKIINTISKNGELHQIKKNLPFFPFAIVKSQIIKKKEKEKFFYLEEPMWSSCFRILSSTKFYKKVNFPVTVIGESQNSNSFIHSKISQVSNKNEIKKFDKNFKMNFKFCNKIFPEFNNSFFIKFNRFIGLEVILKSFKKFKFNGPKINKNSILLEVYKECLSRNLENNIFSYLAEIKFLRNILNKNYSINFLEIKNLFFFRFLNIFFKNKNYNIYKLHSINLDLNYLKN